MVAEAHEPVTPRWERLLDLDGDLADALSDDEVAHARDRIGVATVVLEPGSWRPNAFIADADAPFALLVCDGLVVRELDLAGTVTADLVGPGDIVAIDGAAAALVATSERWHIIGRTRVAILDDRVLPALHAYPAIAARLIARAARQAARAAEQRAISQLPRVELRIRALLWHLAERWGRMGVAGVVVPIELTHGALGHLMGARRPTVTLALSELGRDGAVIRRDDGAWVLRADSNPSVADRRGEATTPGVDAVAGLALAPALRVAKKRPASPTIAGEALAERIRVLREATAEQQVHTAAVLARCGATCQRSRLARGRPIRTPRSAR